MDRFLSTKSVRKTHLQILAAACLLLASKLREPSCRALSADLLVFYTDNSIHKADLIVNCHFNVAISGISPMPVFVGFCAEDIFLDLFCLTNEQPQQQQQKQQQQKRQ
uniref:Cyclin N-terminal domain-containing protein n=1 Tax=Glossina brevipalpis TaxID=37001 RepID=A0A1A9WIP4_9MUSC